MVAELTGANQKHQLEEAIKVLKPIPAIEYALVVRERASAQGGDDLYVDYQLTGARQLNVAIHKGTVESAPIRTWALDPKDALPRRFRWDKTIGGQAAGPGDYQISFSLKCSAQPP